MAPFTAPCCPPPTYTNTGPDMSAAAIDARRMADEVVEDDRTIELSSIAAIFPELIVDPSDPYHATLELPVTPLKPLRIKFGTVQDGGVHETQELEHLPSLKLDISLSERYPINDPPTVHLLVDQQWLPRKTLHDLEAACARLWEEIGRDQVIYSYVDYLQQQSENGFGLARDEESAVPMPADLKLTLLDFDLRVKREKFERETFDCGICLDPKKGKDCHRLLLCGHVFCTACLTDFYTNCISEGGVDSVKCMDPSCGKDTTPEPPRKKRRQDRTLNPSELLQIPLSQELVQRYVRLKRKKKLESSKNTIYCPRQWCQGSAYPEHRQQKSADNFDDFSESEDEAPNVAARTSHSDLLSIPMNQRLAICSDCSYAFCLVCQKTWHGSHSTAAQHCNPRNPKEVAAEEQASIDYLIRYSTPCPTCAAPAQKTMGCNHMICFRCNTHFCYLCSSYLMQDNPYIHFNDKKSTCYMKLWQLEGGDGEGVDNHWAGVEGEGAAWDEDVTSEYESGEDAPQPAPIPLGPIAMPPVVAQADDEDTSDEEPAPDIRRRERAIEFVNFANPAAGRRINIPDRERPENIVPPQAPEPPRNNRRGRGQPANRQRRQQNEPPHNQRQQQQPVLAGAVQQARALQLEEVRAGIFGADAILHRDDAQDPVAAEEPNNNPPPHLPRAAPGQNNNDAGNPAPARAMGLERFLELARLDAEDEWDSDELDENDEGEWAFAADGGAGGAGGAAAGANAPMQEGRVRGNNAGVEARIARREGRNHWGRRGL